MCVWCAPEAAATCSHGAAWASTMPCTPGMERLHRVGLVCRSHIGLGFALAATSAGAASGSSTGRSNAARSQVQPRPPPQWLQVRQQQHVHCRPQPAAPGSLVHRLSTCKADAPFLRAQLYSLKGLHSQVLSIHVGRVTHISVVSCPGLLQRGHGTSSHAVRCCSNDMQHIAPRDCLLSLHTQAGKCTWQHGCATNRQSRSQCHAARQQQQRQILCCSKSSFPTTTTASAASCSGIASPCRVRYSNVCMHAEGKKDRCLCVKQVRHITAGVVAERGGLLHGDGSVWGQR